MSKRYVLFITAGLAFCSLAYELIFTQVLSVIFGSQLKQYNLTVSLFTCSLGFGTLVFHHLFPKYHWKKIFLWVEISLAIMGSLGPFLIVISANIMPHFLAYTFSLGLIFFIGFFSGFELPLMIQLLRNHQGVILASDYLGMVLAAVATPFFLLFCFGVGSSALVVAFTNLFFLFLTLNLIPFKGILMISYASIVVILFGFREVINSSLSYLYVLRFIQ